MEPTGVAKGEINDLEQVLFLANVELKREKKDTVLYTSMQLEGLTPNTTMISPSCVSISHLHEGWWFPA